MSNLPKDKAKLGPPAAGSLCEVCGRPFVNVYLYPHGHPNFCGPDHENAACLAIGYEREKARAEGLEREAAASALTGKEGLEPRGDTSVLQSWLTACPIRMQSVLVLGLRGPDTHCAPHVKGIGRWLRGLAFRPGNPDNVLEFMRVGAPPRIVEKDGAAKELEFCSQHFYSHLMHALEVVAYRHPEAGSRAAAFDLFEDMCRLMHVPVETPEQFEARLCTRAWPGGGQPETASEAATALNLASEQPRRAPDSPSDSAPLEGLKDLERAAPPQAPRVGVALLVTDSNGRVLFGQRGKEPNRGLWVLPGGGVRFGEHWRETGERELREETGLIVEVDESVAPIFVEVMGDNEHRIILTARARMVGGVLRHATDLLDAGFFGARDWPSLSPVAREMLAKFGFFSEQPAPQAPSEET